MDALEDWFAPVGPSRRRGAELVDDAVDLVAARTDLTRVDALAADARRAPYGPCSGASTGTSGSARSGCCAGAGSRTRSA